MVGCYWRRLGAESLIAWIQEMLLRLSSRAVQTARDLTTKLLARANERRSISRLRGNLWVAGDRSVIARSGAPPTSRFRSARFGMTAVTARASAGDQGAAICNRRCFWFGGL